jgi:hypothetical protein
MDYEFLQPMLRVSILAVSLGIAEMRPEARPKARRWKD